MGTRFGMEIRAAAAADAPGLSALLAAAGRAVPPAVLARRLDALRAQPGAALVAVAWGPPSGLVVLHWAHTLQADPPVARITTLLVAEDERRRGIGRLLVKAAAQAARAQGCDALELAGVAPDVPAGAASGAGMVLDGFCAATGFAPHRAGFVRGLRRRG